MNTIDTARNTVTNNGIPALPHAVAEEFVTAATTAETIKEVADLLQKQFVLAEQIKEIQDRNEKLRIQVGTMRDAVRNAFLEEIESAKDSAEFDLEQANDLLEEIGAKKISFTWSVTVKSTITISGIEASDREEAERLAYDAVSFDTNLDNLGDDASVDEEDISTGDAEPDKDN